MIRILHVPSTTIYGSVELLSPSQLPRQLYNAAIAIAQITGLAYLEDYEPAWFIALFSSSSILAVAAALAFSLRACTKAPHEGGNTPLDGLLLLCVLSLRAVLSSSLVLNIELRSVYLFLWYLLLSLSVVSLVKRCGSRGKRLIMSMVCFLSLSNLYVSYAPNVYLSVQKPENLWSQVADDLKSSMAGGNLPMWWPAIPMGK